METFVDDVEPAPGGGAASNEVDMGMVKQLMHSHNNLMAEKKQMEDYFEDVEHESQKKNQAISSLQERLAKMKQELDNTKLKAKNARADAEHLDAERKHDDAKRRRRTLPTKPSRLRIKEYSPGEPASVIALDADGLSRDQLLAEIRSLESDLEYKHQESGRWETALGRLKDNHTANSRMAGDTAHWNPTAAHEPDREEGGGDSLLQERGSYHDPDDGLHDSSPAALPTKQRNIADIFADHGNVPAFVSVVDGQLEHIVVGLVELFEQAQFAAQIEAEAAELQAALDESDTQSHQLRDMLDEVNHQLEDARSELREQSLMSPGAESMASDLASLDGHRGESLSDVLSGVGQIDTSIVDQVEEEQRLRAMSEGELESARAEVRKLKQDNADLQDTITASREVLGMTIEEQMVMIGDQIQVKIELDEANDLVEETKEAMKKVKWEHSMLAEHVKQRDQAIYQLLSNSIKARDRKSLLTALKDTEYTGASSATEDLPMRGAEIAPAVRPAAAVTAAESPRPGRSSFFGRKAAVANNAESSGAAPAKKSGATPAKDLERSTSAGSLRAAPPARPFPPGIMHQVKDGGSTSPAARQGKPPDPGGATATSTPGKGAAAPCAPGSPEAAEGRHQYVRKLWRDAIEQQIMLNKMEAQLRALA